MTTIALDVPSVIAAGNSEPWSGMPAGTVLGHVHLYVQSIDDAERFYHSAVGFDKVVWSYPGALFMSAGGYHHHLGTNTWAAGAPVSTDDDARLIEWEIVVPTLEDVDEAAAAIAAAGFETRRDGTGVAVRDPWGTQLRLVAA
jgi:catechol 2,3-dioxygenase